MSISRKKTVKNSSAMILLRIIKRKSRPTVLVRRLLHEFILVQDDFSRMFLAMPFAIESCRGSRRGAFSVDLVPQPCHEQVLARHQDQGKERSENQSEDHCPGQRSPEHDVVTTEIDMRVQFS